MSIVTDDLKVAIPEAIAEQYGITPGSDVEFVAAGEELHMVVSAPRPAAAQRTDLGAEERVQRFDNWLAETRALVRPADPDRDPADTGRDWTRADLYEPPRGWPRDWPL